MDPYDMVREASNGLPAPAVHDRMLRDREWAPRGGTSMNHALRLDQELKRRFREALGAMVRQTPGMVAHRIDTDMPFLYWEDTTPREGYTMYCGVEHRGAWPPEAQRTFLNLQYEPETFGDGTPRTELHDGHMTGVGARNGGVLAAMVMEHIRQHNAATGRAWPTI